MSCSGHLGRKVHAKSNCVGSFYVKAADSGRCYPTSGSPCSLAPFPCKMASPVHREASCADCHFRSGGARPRPGTCSSPTTRAPSTAVPVRPCGPRIAVPPMIRAAGIHAGRAARRSPAGHAGACARNGGGRTSSAAELRAPVRDGFEDVVGRPATELRDDGLSRPGGAATCASSASVGCAWPPGTIPRRGGATAAEYEATTGRWSRWSPRAVVVGAGRGGGHARDCLDLASQGPRHHPAQRRRL